jgi:hypothetical protein
MFRSEITERLSHVYRARKLGTRLAASIVPRALGNFANRCIKYVLEMGLTLLAI